MTALADRFETAVRLATEAAALALRMQPPPGATHAALKGAQDWLTEADGAVERLLSERLAQAYPADGFQGEEGGKARSGTLRWIVDPIDGTANFMRGSKRFCVSLGCLDGDVPVIGVVVAPAMGETFAAATGKGATLNGVAIRAAETNELTRATVELGWSQRRPRRRSWRWPTASLPREPRRGWVVQGRSGWLMSRRGGPMRMSSCISICGMWRRH